MFCPNCGKKFLEDSNTCIHCGFVFDQVRKVRVQDIIRNVIIQRLEGLKNRDAKAIEQMMYKERYTKFDDWPPFEIQGLKLEAKALKVLKEYNYETRTWKIEVFDDSAIAMFIIRYNGRMRELTFNIQSRVTVFLIKFKGEWKIVHEHWSRFLPKRGKTPISKPILL